ncbi:hypothetical protein DOY81_006031, partial [Sarcophaga bullata]
MAWHGIAKEVCCCSNMMFIFELLKPLLVYGFVIIFTILTKIFKTIVYQVH